MASQSKKNKRKVSYRLHTQRSKTLPTEEDALDYLEVANLMERRYRTKNDRRDEVELWIKRRYITVADAVASFPSYSDHVEVNQLGTKLIDWAAILEQYSGDRIDASQSVNKLSANHVVKMTRAKTAINWLKQNYPDLQVPHKVLQEEINQQRRDAVPLSTQEKWIIAMRQILSAAIELKMIGGENPAEKIKVRRRGATRVTPNHRRHILPDEWIKSLLPATFDMVDLTKEEPRLKVRKPLRGKSKLSLIAPEELDALPHQVSRQHLRKLLNVAPITLQRYMKDGLLPYIKPNQGNQSSHSPHNTISKSIVIEWVKNSKESVPENFYFEKRTREKVAMRGMFPLAFRIGLFCGLRNSEIVWLPWDHVDLDRRILRVTKVTSPRGEVWSPKSDKEENEEVTEFREIGMVQELVDLFKAERKRLKKHNLFDFFIFPSGNPRGPVDAGKPNGPRVLNENFQKLLRYCGYPTRKEGGNHTFYSLRHCYATGLLREGEELRTVQERMGHADIRTTQHYLHAVEANEIVEDRLASRWASSDIASQ
jgi:integrase